MPISLEFLNKKLPGYLILLIIPLVFLVSFIFFKRTEEKIKPAEVKPCPENMSQLRSKKFSYTSPLLLTDMPESEVLLPIREKADQLLAAKKKDKEISDYAVYFRRMNGGLWFSLNPNTEFRTGIIRPLACMLACLKTEDDHAGYLDSKINGSTASVNGMYSVRQLMIEMLCNGKDEAERVLQNHVNQKIYNQIFEELSISKDKENIIDVTKVYRVLYNGTYLRDNALAEYALKLLAENGVRRNADNHSDSTITVSSLRDESIPGEMSDVAIVYYKDSPYLIAVKVKGQNKDKMKETISAVAVLCQNEYMTMME
jgi:hypothetical protein